MRNAFLFSLLALGLLAIGIGVNGADRSSPAAEPLKIPAPLVCGTVWDNQLIGVTDTGKLLVVDLKQRSVRNLGSPGGKLVAALDAADGKVCVADNSRVHIVGLADGETVRSMEFKGTVRGVGFAGDDRIFVHDGDAVTVLDAAGKVLHRIGLPVGGKARGRNLGQVAFHRVGRLLYTGTAIDGDLRVVDLVDGKLLDTIPSNDWQIGGVYVNGDTAHVLSYHLSYGIWTGSLARVDLKTKKRTVLERPELRNYSVRYTTYAAHLLRGPQDTLVVSTPTGTWAYNAAGKVSLRVAEQGEERCLGVWSGQALLADKTAIRFVMLTDAPKAE